ncbi:hypothetical protein N3K66_006137 [Trichothecium roseum]|uniref:Uncharacterized protein n=1 Tax=Trichothecium roseum TaxID=47278 RepID=A0ACC0UZY9_9HYPO|nr:hypothetical protein N3K66_006137 [Trichothecium roseum]
MQFSIFSLVAIATVAWAAPQSECPADAFYYSDRNTLEPCKNLCEPYGGKCELGDCPPGDDPILLCPTYCRC